MLSLLLLTATLAQDPAHATPPPAAAVHQTAEAEAGHAGPSHEPAAEGQAATGHPEAAPEHGGAAASLMHHVVDARFDDLMVGGINLGPTKHLLFFVMAAAVALAWLLRNPVVCAPIIGPRTVEQLDSAIRATEIRFDQETADKLEAIFPGPGGTAPNAYAW